MTIDKKQSRYSNVFGIEFKELEEMVVGGFIATTHIDSGFFDADKGVWMKDKIAKETLQKWADEINAGVPRANKVSINHNREPHVAGVALKGSAGVRKLPDGEYGLYVESLVDKTKENFDDTKYRLENNLLDSFSIEFTTKDPMTGEYLPNAAFESSINGGVIRTLLPGTILEGYTLASQPMNEHAIRIKEIGGKMEEVKEVVQEPPKVEVKEEPKPEVKEVPKPEVKEVPKVEEVKVVEQKEAIKEVLKELKEEVKEEIAKIEVKEKVMKNPGEIRMEQKEYKDYRDTLGKSDILTQFKTAARLAESKGLITADGAKQSVRGSMAAKEFSVNGTKMEFKGLGMTTNQNSDTDYLISAAELSDVFDPVIYNALNQATVTWNILAKDDFSNKGNNQVQFALKTVKNATVGAYLGNAVNTGNVTRLKYQTKFKKYQVGVEVDGDMIAAARGGPIGDVFAQEVADSTNDLLADINEDLFAEVGLETAAGVIGFEYLADSAGNTTLYSLTRSAANKLAPDSAGSTYIEGAAADLSITNLRAAKRNALEEGAMLQNLVYIGSPIQGDKLRSIYDSAQRLVPTSSRYGFEGMMSFDGIPFFEDKDCNDDDVFLIDLETHRVAIWVPPTLEMLGKDADSQKGFIKTYFATYNRCPRRICMIRDNATA